MSPEVFIQLFLQEQTIKASQASQLENELAKLREENVILARKVNELSGMEAARKKSDAKVQQMEEHMEESISEKIIQRENELNATYDERMRNYEDRYAPIISPVGTSAGLGHSFDT